MVSEDRRGLYNTCIMMLENLLGVVHHYRYAWRMDCQYVQCSGNIVEEHEVNQISRCHGDPAGSRYACVFVAGLNIQAVDFVRGKCQHKLHMGCLQWYRWASGEAHIPY